MPEIISFDKEFMAIRFEKGVPEYSAAAFATCQEAIDYAKRDMFDYGDLRPVYIVELKGLVAIDYKEKYP